MSDREREIEGGERKRERDGAATNENDECANMHGNDCYSVDVHLSAFLLPADKEMEITSDECCPRKTFIFPTQEGKRKKGRTGEEEREKCIIVTPGKYII